MDILLANRILESNLFEAFDMPIDISVKEIGERLIEYINRTDITKGLIILVDMGSLKDIHNQIKDYINYPIAIINNVSTQIALYIGSLLNKDLYIVLKLLSIDEVYSVAKEYICGTTIKFKELLNDTRIINTSRFIVELAYSFYTRNFSVNELSSTRKLDMDTRNFIINILNYYEKKEKEVNTCA